MPNDTNTDKDTIRSTDDTIGVSKCETNLTDIAVASEEVLAGMARQERSKVEHLHVRDVLDPGDPLPVVLGDLMRQSALLLKAEAEKWKDVARQSQRDRDDWQARQASAESEVTKRMLERDVLGDKLVDALGVPHRTIHVAAELRHGRPMPADYKDEAEHPLVVRLAEVLTGRPMGTELPESIVARATAEVLAWMDAPKVPVVRLPPVLGRPLGLLDDLEVERWKKSAEVESARADRAEARVAELEAEVAGEQLEANTWREKLGARADGLSRTLSDLRASLITALRVDPDADHGDAALIGYATKAIEATVGLTERLTRAEDEICLVRRGLIEILKVHPEADHSFKGLLDLVSKAVELGSVDGRAYNDGRAEGRADIAAKLRAIIDPKDNRKLDVDGLVARLEVAKEEVVAAESKAERALGLGRRVGALLGYGSDVKLTDLPTLAELLEKRWTEMDDRLRMVKLTWEAAPTRVAAVNLLARLLHESGRKPVQRGENIAQQSTFTEWADLHARVKQGRAMTASAMLDSMLIAAAPAPAGSTRLSGECLARELHRCEKAAIESGFTARQHSTTWIPFDELPEAAKKGRMAQSEFLENTCDLAFFVWDK